MRQGLQRGIHDAPGRRNAMEAAAGFTSSGATVGVAIGGAPAGRRPVSVVSTTIVDVPWPDLIDPADTVQLKVAVISDGPPLTSAVNVRSAPACTESGHETFTAPRKRVNFRFGSLTGDQRT